jgi:hypothetical protein
VKMGLKWMGEQGQDSVENSMNTVFVCFNWKGKMAPWGLIYPVHFGTCTNDQAPKTMRIEENKSCSATARCQMF